MKSRLLLALTGACLLLAGAAFAQWQPRATVYVPFEFVVGNTVLPAGSYTVMAQSGKITSQLMFRNKHTGAAAIAQNIDIGMPANTYVENSNLVFVLDASGRHVLHEVWMAGDGHGHNLVHEAGIPEPK